MSTSDVTSEDEDPDGNRRRPFKCSVSKKYRKNYHIMLFNITDYYLSLSYFRIASNWLSLPYSVRTQYSTLIFYIIGLVNNNVRLSIVIKIHSER
jgi:hypothetical protein